MKKLNLLIVLALVVSAILMAATPVKLVRLNIINNSGGTIYMKLTGENTDAFYYLTVPDGEDMTFTVLTDKYARETWGCDGLKSSGDLFVTGNLKLRFTDCNFGPPMKWAPVRVWDCVNGVWVYVTGPYIDPCTGQEMEGVLAARVINRGEPSMEKVWHNYWYSGDFGAYDCGVWTIKKTTKKVPFGCFYWYRY